MLQGEMKKASPVQKVKEISLQSRQIQKPFIGSIKQTPEYMRDDKLQVGYRINFNSYSQILKSLFQFHNETINIWTHFGGAIIMLFIISSVIYYQFNHTNDGLRFQGLIQNFQTQNTQCNIKSAQLIEKGFLPQALSTKLKNEICHPHGKQYFGDFLCEIAQSQIKLFKDYVLTHFGQNMKQIQQLKLHWQKDVIPTIVHQVQRQSNISLIQYIRQQMQVLKDKLDSDRYQYIQLGGHSQNPQNVSRFPLIFILLCAVACLGCSTIFHLFNAMSSRAYLISISFDYAGINIFISGSVFPALYYGMYCYLNVAYFYMTIILGMGAALFGLSLCQWSRKPENFVLRSIFYGGFSFFMTIPVAHLIVNQIFFHNYGDQFSFIPSIHWYILGGLSFTIGLMVFTKRCPDRNHPGKYDMCGHSHQIWHTLVLMGMFFLYFGSCVNYESRKQFSCPATY